VGCVPVSLIGGGTCSNQSQCHGSGGYCSTSNEDPRVSRCTCLEGFVCPHCDMSVADFLVSGIYPDLNFVIVSHLKLLIEYGCPNPSVPSSQFGGSKCKDNLICSNPYGQCVSGRCHCSEGRACSHCQVSSFDVETRAALHILLITISTKAEIVSISWMRRRERTVRRVPVPLK